MKWGRDSRCSTRGSPAFQGTVGVASREPSTVSHFINSLGSVCAHAWPPCTGQRAQARAWTSPHLLALLSTGLVSLFPCPSAVSGKEIQAVPTPWCLPLPCSGNMAEREVLRSLDRPGSREWVFMWMNAFGLQSSLAKQHSHLHPPMSVSGA